MALSVRNCVIALHCSQGVDGLIAVIVSQAARQGAVAVAVYSSVIVTRCEVTNRQAVRE